MTTYTVRQGDTFESISRSQFGTVGNASNIIAANPGASNPPTAGSVLFLPIEEKPLVPIDVQPREVSVMIDGTRFIGWTQIGFSRVMDSFGTFNLLSAWEPDNIAFRNAFRPLSYKSVSIFEGSELLFNGTMINGPPSQSAKQRIVTASGYSIPGVINDCTAPISSLPLERDAQNLEQIATALLRPFGITVDIQEDSGPAFQREAITPEQKIYDYLISLAKQRNLIITDTPLGACKFQKETATGNPVAVLEEGQPGITSITPFFNPQEYYSHISGQGFTLFSPANAAAGSIFTIVNPNLTGVLRPLTFSSPDSVGGDIKTAVEAKVGRMFGNAAGYAAVIPSWRDPSGKLWEPNKTITITAPGAMIYKPYEFLIRGVEYRKTSKEEVAILSLVLPGAFSGVIPESLPWDE